MKEMGPHDFSELCREGEVRSRLVGLDQARSDAVRRFWFTLGGAIALALAVLVSLLWLGWLVAGLILALIVVIVGLVMAFQPLNAVKEDLKQPVLEAIAKRGEMEYLADGFDPPVFPEARKTLFGSISSFAFTDLFHGTDADGLKYAMYEATLTQRSGKNTHTIFQGQFYAFQRRPQGGGETVIVPDKGLFNFFKPSGFERVKIDGDPAFEKKFEVYSKQPSGALAALGTEARRGLLVLREEGRVWAWISGDDVLVGVWGKNRFEPGSMFRARPGQERAQAMFDEVCATLRYLRRLKTLFG